MLRVICLLPILGYSVIPGIEIFARIAELHAPKPSDTEVPPAMRSLISQMIIAGDFGDDDNFVDLLSRGFILSDLADVFAEAIDGSVTPDQRSAVRSYLADVTEPLWGAIRRRNGAAIHEKKSVIRQQSQAFRDQFIWLRELRDHVFRVYVNGHHVMVSAPLIELYASEFMSHLVYMESVLYSTDPFHASHILQAPRGIIQSRVLSIVGHIANPSTASAIYVTLKRCYATVMERRTARDSPAYDAIKADISSRVNSKLHTQVTALDRISVRLGGI
jgi:hypothetical protein